MKSTNYIDEISKQWWYLWNSNPCCLLKKQNDKTNNSSEKSLETRAEILIAAFHEIYKSGFQAASLSNILKNTGTSKTGASKTVITKGALYHHFDNKIVLGYAVLDEVIRVTIHANWIEPLNNTDDPITVLQDILVRSGSLMTEADISRGCPLNNLAQEMSPIDEGFRDRIADIYQEWQDATANALERGKAKGNVIDSIDSKEIALLFVSSIQGCIGFAKSVQKLDTLMTCGKGLIDRLESLRPLN